jgi:hypothetical protein
MAAANDPECAEALRDYLAGPRLVPQSYGLAMAQGTFGGPRGIWLECSTCPASDRLINIDMSIPDKEAAKVYRAHGWTGVGDEMKKAHCPKCSKGARLVS